MPFPCLQRIGLLVVVSLLVACAGGGGTVDEGDVTAGDVYPGLYEGGTETSAFTPCGADHAGERWWVIADSTAHAAWERGGVAGGELRPHLSVRAYTLVRGTITDTGRYGHLGAYNRELRVEEVLEVRPPEAESGCS